VVLVLVEVVVAVVLRMDVAAVEESYPIVELGGDSISCKILKIPVTREEVRDGCISSFVCVCV
jgi:hypothetical protein